MREMIWAADEGVKTMIYVFDIRRGAAAAAAVSEGGKVRVVGGPASLDHPSHSVIQAHQLPTPRPRSSRCTLSWPSGKCCL